MAVIFAFETYSRDGCEDACDIICNDDQFMDVTLFLQVVGFSFMGISLISVCLLIFIVGSEDRSDTGVAVVICFRVISILYILSWLIVGWILRSETSDECKDTPKGRVLYAWCILYSFSICNACYSLSNSRS